MNEQIIEQRTYKGDGETHLQRLIRDYHENGNRKEIELPLMLKVVDMEFRLIKAETLVTNTVVGHNDTCVGRIDVIFKMNRCKYITEIKSKSGGNFWPSTKAIAYCAYYKWQTNEKRCFPAVLLEKQSVGLTEAIIAQKLGLTIFVHEKLANGKIQISLYETNWF
jgi:hypothetical protein